MNHRIKIQQLEQEITNLSSEIKRLSCIDLQTVPPSFYICTRCGLLYQSIYGCGCPRKNTDENTKTTKTRKTKKASLQSNYQGDSTTRRSGK